MGFGDGSRCWKCYHAISAEETMIKIVFRYPNRGVEDAPIHYHLHDCPAKFLKRKLRIVSA